LRSDIQQTIFMTELRTWLNMHDSDSQTAASNIGQHVVALTIAGSDPSGGAGLQADLKTFHQHRVYGMSVVTLITVQNTQTVSRVEMLPQDLIREQLEAVVQDIPPQAAKTGALGDRATILTVAEHAVNFTFPLVVDPVMISKHGMRLIEESAVDALRHALLPHCFLLTPNLHEAETLTGDPVRNVADMERAARQIAEMGPRNVLVKGGHLDEHPCDVLFHSGELHHFPGTRYDTPHTHGTGCVYSAAITAQLARGNELPVAVAMAKQFIDRAIRNNPGLGHGRGPVNLMVEP
jgi:hydroxymethylpyrimidine/phosphomethylpyrimidine kinase